MRAKVLVAFGLLFCWALPAYGAFGSMAATAGSFTTTALQPPTSLTASHVCAGADVADFTLDWAPSTSTFAEGYVLTRSRNGVVEGTWSLSPATTTTHAQSGVSVAPAGTVITWDLRAVAAAWTSAPASTAFTVSNPPQCGTASLSVQYRINNTNPSDNIIAPDFRIVNAGAEAVPLSELTLRYWWTRDGSNNNPDITCLSAQIGCGNLTGSIAVVTTQLRYLELAFTPGAGSIAGGHSGDIRIQMQRNQNFDETNDWSWDPTKTSFTTWERVTLYRNGVLVWGVEPP